MRLPMTQVACVLALLLFVVSLVIAAATLETDHVAPTLVACGIWIVGGFVVDLLSGPRE